MNARAWMTIGVVFVLTGTVIADEKEGVAVTVYNGGYGLVREVRAMEIDKDGQVKFKDVAARIDATTVHFKSLTDPAAKLLEQNYQYDLVSADKLLKKYVDRDLEVICKGKGYGGKLLSFDAGQIVLQDEKGRVTMVQRPDNVQDIRFSALPGGLLTQPTLLWLVGTDKPGKHLAEVTYQTYGLSWHAEYVLVLGADDKTADLTGWVSVDNTSGKSYRQAKMKFIAGDVRRVSPPPTAEPRSSGRLAKDSGSTAPMAEKAFFEYHLYTLPRPSTVADNETKQLEMFPPAAGLKVEKKYLYNPLGGFHWYPGNRYTDRTYGVSSDKKVAVFVEFFNSEANKLGIPLPAGKVRVCKQDPDDKAMEFVGEEQIDHTPRDEKLSLQIGNAFDVVGERRQTGFQVESNRNWMSESIEIKVRNHKKEAVVVRCKEPLFRWSTARVTEASEKYEHLDAHTVAFDVKVEPDKEKVVTYTVEYTW